jgi:prepilin-type N-terminal cleavage/methylation domain-containing protein
MIHGLPKCMRFRPCIFASHPIIPPATQKKAMNIHIAGKARNSRGFTLVEVLVTIMIIITLAALIFVGMKRMKSSADKVVYTRNTS